MESGRLATVRWMVVTVLCCLTLVACNKDVSDAEYLQKAQTHFAEGEFRAARIELKNAVQRNPDNSAARSLLGRIHVMFGDPQSAEKELTRARELDPDDNSGTAALVTALVQLGRSDDALAIDVSDLIVDDRVEALVSQGLGLLQQGSIPDARVKISTAIGLDPNSPYALTSRARLATTDGLFDSARDDLQQALALDERYLPAWELLGDIEWGAGDFPAADSAYEQALELQKKNVFIALKRAQVLLVRNKVDEASVIVDNAVKLDSDNPVGQLLKGVVHIERKEYSQAQTSLETSLAKAEDYQPAMFHLARVHLLQGNVGQATQYAKTFFNASPESVQGKKLMAQLHIENRDFRRAEELLRTLVDNQEHDSQVSRMLASALFKMDRMDEALGVLAAAPADGWLASAAEQAPTNPGDDAGTSSVLSEFGKLTPDQETIDRIMSQARAGEQTAAQQSAEEFRAANPDSPTPLMLIGRLHLANGDNAAARTSLEKALDIAPGNPPAGVLLAQMSEEAGDVSTARSLYRSILDVNPEHLPTLMRLAQLEAGEQNSEGMLDALEAARRVSPRLLEPRLVLARYHVAQREPEKALEVLDELPASVQSDRRAMFARTGVLMELGRFADAKTILNSLLAIDPDNPEFRFLLATSYLNLGDSERAFDELQRTVELQPERVDAHIGIARLAVSMKRTDDYAEALANIERLDPTNEAIAAIKSAARGDASPTRNSGNSAADSTATVLQRARDYWQAGQKEQALSVLDSWISRNPSDLPVLLSAALGYAQIDRVDDAVLRYRQALAVDRNNAVALNNLAWYLRTSKPEEALGFASRALALSPDSASTLDTVAVVQLINGRVEDARVNIDKALSLEPNQPSLRFHRAQILAASGDKDTARSELESLLGSGADFPEIVDAQALFDSL